MMIDSATNNSNSILDS